VQTAVLEEQEFIADSGEAKLPVVIVGTGPVGIRIAQELLRHAPDTPIVQYGAEPWKSYCVMLPTHPSCNTAQNPGCPTTV